MKKKPSAAAVRKRSTQSVLEARIVTKRIAWLWTLRCIGRTIRLSFVIGLIALAGWGVWRGIVHAFYENPDFRLQVIEMNLNPVVDEVELANSCGIDFEKSIFHIKPSQVAAVLDARPEILEATVHRELPGVLHVSVTPRVARVWLGERGSSSANARAVGGLLADENGFVFRCQPRQLGEVEALPVIELDSGMEPEPGTTLDDLTYQRCLALLDSALAEDAEAFAWIDAIYQEKPWSITLRTRAGTCAEFGLREHPRQLSQLRMALDHAALQRYDIATISLIPKENIPITLVREPAPPRAIPVEEPTEEERREEARKRDLDQLLGIESTADLRRRR